MQSLMRLGAEVRAGTESLGRFLKKEKKYQLEDLQEKTQRDPVAWVVLFQQLLSILMPTQKSKIVSDYATFATALTPIVIVDYKDSKGAPW